MNPDKFMLNLSSFLYLWCNNFKFFFIVNKYGSTPRLLGPGAVIFFTSSKNTGELSYSKKTNFIFKKRRIGKNNSRE